MSNANTVTVSNLNLTTSKSVLEHFFSFCGKIENIEENGTEAKITFVKESATKTALMLNGGTLEGSTISVKSDHVEIAPELASAKAATTEVPSAGEHDDVEQEDKPHSAVAAELLAHGYTLTDAAIQKAIATDHQYGISSRFLSFFNPVATKVQETAQPHLDRAQAKLGEVDASKGISLKAQAAAIIGSKYYNAALASPFGSKVRAFYTNTSKQVLDVHEEALRIKESKKLAATDSSATTSSTAPATTLATDEKVSEVKTL